MKEVFFSIILPTYNRADKISKAIQSVVDQKYPNWELVIIDDGSTDRTREVVGQFFDDRIRYVYQENQERSAARNYGINLAKGDFICFLDSDDYYLNNFLLVFNDLIKSSSYKDAFYACNTYKDIGEDDLIKESGFNYKFPCKNKYDFLLNNFIGTPRVCLPTKILKKNHFDINIKNGEDFELWFRVVKDLEIITSDQYTQVFVDHNGRSINSNLEVQLLSSVEFLNSQLSEYRTKFSRKAVRSFRKENNLRLARYYFANISYKTIIYAFKAICFSDIKESKEMIYMILKTLQNMIFSSKKGN